MGGQQSKINIDQVKITDIMSLTPDEKINFQPPFRRFKSQYIKKIGVSTLCLVEVESPYQQHIQITQHIYEDLEDAFEDKTKGIIVQHPFFDELYYDKLCFRIKNKQKTKNISLRPFKSYDSNTFANILCQINITKHITELGCPNLQTLNDYYVIETGIEEEDLANTQIIVLQSADTTLSQIIKYRRDNKWSWTVDQFTFLLNNLLTGLHTLHSNKIAHNDIRPSNIYYSSDKNCYFLGCFCNSFSFSNNQLSKTKLKTSRVFAAPESQQFGGYNMFDSDVYALGITLLSAFYLYEPISLKGCASYNKKLQDSYKFMRMIISMVNPNPKLRINSAQLFSMLIPCNNQSSMKILIPSLKYKNSAKDEKIIKQKYFCTIAAQRLGLWDDWKANLKEMFNIQENQLDDFNKAVQLQKIAQCQYYMGQISSASQYAKRSARLYRTLGYTSLDQGNYDYSIALFTKAIQTSKYFDEQDNYDYAKNLQGLSIAHAQKNQYQLSKSYLQQSINIVKKCKGYDSGQFIQLKITLAKIQTQFRQFSKSHEILEECLNITQKKSQINKNLSLKIKAQILQQKGKNYMHQSVYQSQNKNLFMQKSQQCLYQALKINQTLQGDNNISISDNLQNIALIQFKKKDFNTAKVNFFKALSLRQQSNHNEVRKDINSKERAQLLCYIADCDTSLKQYTRAMENYQLALSIYRKKYGTDHNFYSAMIIGNMGRIYKSLNDIKKAKQCVKCAKDILADLRGIDDPDYEYFKEVEQLLNKKE